MDNDEGIVVSEGVYEVAKVDRTWAMLSHFAAFIGFISTVGIPLGNILGPLVIWIFKKDTSQFVSAHGKESMNFQISFSIYTFILTPLAFIPIIGWFFIAPILFILYIMNLLLILLAGIKANDGRAYRYPMTIRFIK